MLKFLVCLLQLIISPAKGWDAIADEDVDPRRLCSEGFYPLIGLVACTVFIQYFYNSDFKVAWLLQKAVITFIQYFITYFLASFIFSLFLSKMTESGEAEEKRYHTFIIYNLALLGIFQMINNCLPVEISIFQFLPFFDIFIIWFGIPYLSIADNKKIMFLILSVVAIMAPPYILGYLLYGMLPAAPDNMISNL